jgi:two-component system sensor histidine kinase KdpD
MQIFKQHSFSLAIVLLLIIFFISNTFKNEIGLINIALIHLIPILIVALHGNMFSTLFITTISVIVFHFIHLPPAFGFAFNDFLYFWNIVIFYLVGYIITKQAQILEIKTQEANIAKVHEQTSEFREILLNSISHDLKTPLSSMNAIIDLMQTKKYDKDIEDELLFSMKKSSLKMNRLISGLLDSARLQDKHRVLQMDWCDFEDLVGIALSEFETSEVKNLVEVEFGKDLELYWGDSALLVQLLVNLFDNAFKYNQNSGKIKISIVSENGYVYIRFFNYSKPISKDELEVLFDKFYRLKENGDINGSGIGLFICKSITKAHNGEARAYQENDGITFEMKLPILKELNFIDRDIQ